MVGNFLEEIFVLSGAIFDLYTCHIQGHLSQHTQPHRSDQTVGKFNRAGHHKPT